MIDQATVLGQAWRMMASGAQRLPAWMLRRRWPDTRILSAVEAFHFDQAPRFYVRSDRPTHELDVMGFNVFNFTPLRLSIVAADLQVSVDSTDWLEYRQRFVTESIIGPFSRGGFSFKCALSATLVQLLLKRSQDCVQIHIRGQFVLKTSFGELKKDARAVVVALIS